MADDQDRLVRIEGLGHHGELEVLARVAASGRRTERLLADRLCQTNERIVPDSCAGPVSAELLGMPGVVAVANVPLRCEGHLAAGGYLVARVVEVVVELRLQR